MRAEARPEEEFLTGAWILACGRLQHSWWGHCQVWLSEVEDEPIVGSWFWTEEETSGTFRPQTEQEPIGSSCELEKTNVETEADATSKSVPTDDKEKVINPDFC